MDGVLEQAGVVAHVMQIFELNLGRQHTSSRRQAFDVAWTALTTGWIATRTLSNRLT